MAYAATMVWMSKATGSDSVCSGGFNAALGGTDYTLQDAAQATGTVTSVTTTVTATTSIFTSVMVGNTITDGTTTKEIKTFVSGTVVTVDSAPSWTAATIYVGGALASPGKANGLAVANNVSGYTIYVIGSFTTTTDSANVSGGRLNFSQTGTKSSFNRMLGRTSYASNTPANFTLTMGATFTSPLVTMNNANSFNLLRYVNVVGNGATSGASAVNIGGRSNRFTDWKVSNFTGGGTNVVVVQQNGAIERFEISGGATSNNAALSLNVCVVRQGWVHGNAGRGVQIDGGSQTISRVASTDHTGANGYGFFHATATELKLDKCVADNNAQSGLYLQSTDATVSMSLSVFTRNGGYGVENGASSPDAADGSGCGFYSNTSGEYQTVPNYDTNHKTFPSLPYAGSGDYALNSGGTTGKGISATFPGAGSTSYDDTGVLQHQDSGGSTEPSVFLPLGSNYP